MGGIDRRGWGRLGKAFGQKVMGIVDRVGSACGMGCFMTVSERGYEQVARLAGVCLTGCSTAIWSGRAAIWMLEDEGSHRSKQAWCGHEHLKRQRIRTRLLLSHGIDISSPMPCSVVPPK